MVHGLCSISCWKKRKLPSQAVLRRVLIPLLLSWVNLTKYTESKPPVPRPMMILLPTKKEKPPPMKLRPDIDDKSGSYFRCGSVKKKCVLESMIVTFNLSPIKLLTCKMETLNAHREAWL